MTKNEYLKACPFCGAKVFYRHKTEEQPSGYVAYKIKCAECDAKTCLCSTEEIARKTWNTRANVTLTYTAMEDAVTREDTEEQSSGKSRAVDDLLSTSSTTDGDAERCLEAIAHIKKSKRNILQMWDERIKEGDTDYLAYKDIFMFAEKALQSTRKPHVQIDAKDVDEAILKARSILYARTPRTPYHCVEDELKFAFEVVVSHIERLAKCKPTPVYTINIKREVLQGVRENLELIANVYTNDRHIPADTEAANALHGSLSHCDDLARQALASLDAVLAEGE